MLKLSILKIAIFGTFLKTVIFAGDA